MKQKIVIKVCMNCDRCRKKAMKLAAAACGVSSVALEGDDKLVVIGVGVDAAELTRILRKKVNYATLESIQEVKPPGEDKPKPKPKPRIPSPETTPIPPSCSCRCELYQVVYDPHPTSACTIL